MEAVPSENPLHRSRRHLRPETTAAAGTTFDTTEIRWFATGSMPLEVVAWFTQSGTRGTLEIRQDAYLPAGTPTVGRKRRNHGPFEIKTRLGLGPAFHLDGQLSGRIERWRKVISTRPHLPRPSRQWANVHKVVVTRTYHVGRAAMLVEVHRGDTSVPGCDIELAEVTVNDVEAWTLAFEAWGPEGEQRRILEQAATAFIADTGLPTFVTSQLTVDMGYPAWLAEFIPTSDRYLRPVVIQRPAVDSQKVGS